MSSFWGPHDRRGAPGRSGGYTDASLIADVTSRDVRISSRDLITPDCGAAGTGTSAANIDAHNWMRRPTSDCRRYPTSPQAEDGLGRGRLANL